MVNFLGTLQNEWAGAQAFSSFDTYLAPFIRKDNLSYGEVRQYIQEFIYNLNVPSRWGTQTPFTNITMDWVVPDDPARAGAVDRRRGDALHLRRPPGRTRHDQPRLHRGDDGGRRQGPGVHLPDPDLQHHQGFPLGRPEHRAFVRDDRQVRPALFPELPQFRPGTEHGAVHVLPPAARPARAAEARQRPVRIGRADRLHRRRDRQLRAAGLPVQRRRGRAEVPSRRAAGIGQDQPGDQAQGHPAPSRLRAVPLHQALSRPSAESFLDHRRQRHQRDDPQLHRRRPRHHRRVRPCHGLPAARP